MAQETAGQKRLIRAGSSKVLRSGLVTVGVLDLTKAVTIDPPMPSSSYKVFLQVQAGLATTLWPSALNASGFTLNLSVGVAGDIAWLAVEN